MNRKNGFGLGVSILILLLFTVALWYYSLPFGIAAAVLSAGLTVFMALGMKKREEAFEQYIQQANFVADNATRRLLLDFFLPCILVGRSGSIIWFNAAVSDLLGNDQLIGNPISRYFPQLSQIDHTKENGVTEITLDDKIYSVIYQRIDTKQEQEAYSFVLFDVTEQRHIQTRFEAEHVAIGIILVDNYTEVVSGIPDAERGKLVSDIDSKLYNWAALSDGVIYRLERERFLFVFNKEHLDCLVQNKFSILNDTKEIKNSKNIPVTLSIGVGYDEESIAKSAVSARAALELALGRGGDQTVIKHNDEYTFFGGNSREMEKRTKVKARVVAQALCELVQNAPQVMIMGHKNPDADCIGAAIGIYSIAKHLGTRAHIIVGECNSSVRRILDSFSDDPDYQNAFMEPARAKDAVTGKTLVVVVDIHKPTMVECPEIIKFAPRVVLIDHHRRSTEYIQKPVLVYHEPYASSTCEMVTEILQYIGNDIRISKDEAEALFAGITLDTKNFMVKTGVRTFDAAAYLRRKGVDTTVVRQLFKTDIKTFAQRAKIIETSEVYKKSIAVAHCEIDSNDLQIVANAADELLNITDIEASFVLCLHKGTVHISARSLGGINVQLIMEALGGGGHMTVAGAQLPDITIEETKKRLYEAIDQYLESNQK